MTETVPNVSDNQSSEQKSSASLEKLKEELALLDQEKNSLFQGRYHDKQDKEIEKKIKRIEFLMGAKAIDILYEMSLINDNNGKQVDELRWLSVKHLLKIEDLESVSQHENIKVSPKEIFSFLPSLNKLSRIPLNYINSGGSPIIALENGRTLDIGYMTNTGKHLMCRLLKLAEEDFFEAASGEDYENLMLTLRILFTEGEYYLPNYFVENGLTFLEKYKPSLEEAIRNGNKNIEKEINFFEEYFKTDSFEYVLAKACEDSLKTDIGKLEREIRCPYCETLLKGRLAKRGLDPNKIISAWLRNHTGPNQWPQIWENVLIIHRLEEAQKGATEVLFKEFGIRNFARYSPKTLLEQIKEVKNKEKPYGILLNPVSDHNGAFSDQSKDYQMVNDLTDQLSQKGYLLRIIEAETKTEIARHLIKMHRLYGDRHKIYFILIGGHGSENSIEFGGTDPKQILKLPELEDIFLGKRIQKATNLFEDNFKIVLLSCSTRREGGIAQKISNITGAKVIAPNSTASIEKIDVLEDDEKRIDFDVKFNEGASISKVYNKGNKIMNY